VLKYAITNASFVSVEIFDVRGKLIAEEINQVQSAGSYSLPLSSLRISAGSYVLNFSAGSTREQHMFSKGGL